MWQRRIRSPYSSPLAVNKDSKYCISLSVRNLTHGLWTSISNVTKTTLETIYFGKCVRTRIYILCAINVYVRAFISAGTISGSIIKYRLTQLLYLQVTVLTMSHEIVLAEFYNSTDLWRWECMELCLCFSLTFVVLLSWTETIQVLGLPKATVFNQPEDIL